MATTNSEDTATFSPDHNSQARDAIISECAGDMMRIRQERRTLNDRAAKVRARLKDVGVETRVFDLNVRIAEMEREARINYLQDLAVCYHAINPGGALDWKQATGQETTLAQPISIDEALTAGHAAGVAGEDRGVNPFGAAESNHQHWNDGWDAGQAELAQDAGPVPAAPSDEAAAPA